MSKHLWSWMVASVFSLVFVGTTILFAYWTVMHAPWWQCDLVSFALLAQGTAYFLYGLQIRPVPGISITKADVLCAVQAFWHTILNKLFNPIGLSTTWTDYHELLEEVSNRAVELEARAVVDRLLLASLLSERFGWEIDWFKGGACFQVKIPDEPRVTYPQDLEHIDKVLADITFLLSLPLPATAESEVQHG